MTDLTPDKLDQIEKAASAEIDARTRPGGQLGRIRDEWSDYLRAMPPETALALVARVRELEAQVGRVRCVALYLERGAVELASNGRFGESGICEAHARKLREALGEES